MDRWPFPFDLNPPIPGLFDEESEWDGPYFDNADFSDPATVASFSGMLAPPPTMSPEHLRAKARDLSQAIFAHYDMLKAIVARHEAAIQKRWTKKKKQQKLAILEEAWPGMAKTHRLCHLEAQEDLLKPRTLLLLLNARGRHPPTSFAGADSDAMHFGRVSQNVVPVFLNLYTMVLNLLKDHYKYGDLNLVMEFLVTFCQKMLHDIPPDVLLTDAYPVELEPLLKTEMEIDGFDSMAIMALEAPYRAILRVQMESADDYIWQLWEDLGYFAEQLHEAMEHCQEMLKDTKGDVHPVLSSRFQNLFWTRVMCDTVSGAYMEFELFAGLHKQALHFQLKQSVVASPPMRKFFVREPPADPTSTMISIRSKPGIKKDKNEAEPIWLLQTLWEDSQNILLMGLPFVLDELERLLANEPQLKHLISARIAAHIGSLSSIGHCLRQLEMYQPWARGFMDALVDRDDALKKEFARATSPWGQLLQALNERNPKMQQAAKFCKGTNRFAYPSTKRRTRETTAAIIQAERNLDQFWASIDRSLQDDAGGLRGMSVKQALSRPRPIQRTSEWVKPKPVAKDQPKVAKSNVKVLYKPLSTLYFGHNSGGSAALMDSSPTTKMKTKTRKKTTAEASEAPVAATETAPDPAEEKPEQIKVDTRALKVFRILFYDPAITSTPGEVSWRDFIYALTSTGKFTAEKLYGSVWQFSRIGASDQSRIQFHEPHPHGKVPFVVARRHGRRLSRAYGWTGETFILKS
ncbi:hypothetical protein B0I35DRAFT_449502 [Stachybotrys elegans]|uniref:Uncharacterized protein n=1 Tax=Stachybotrys elegans TaxID=80388 RepID=A0A8K0WUC1_9HYPO|nr:hypothetical protein B0I35DRAFT_449502 [Stachybotrys elegans]